MVRRNLFYNSSILTPLILFLSFLPIFGFILCAVLSAVLSAVLCCCVIFSLTCIRNIFLFSIISFLIFILQSLIRAIIGRLILLHLFQFFLRYFHLDWIFYFDFLFITNLSLFWLDYNTKYNKNHENINKS